MEFYPTELPNPNRSGYARNQEANTIRSNVDIGEAKVRRRYTLPIYNEKWALILDESQVSIFNFWFNDTLASGVNRFRHTDPISQTLEDYRIKDMPTFAPYGLCGGYIVSFSVERLP